jgi:hypothetical protein
LVDLDDREACADPYVHIGDKRADLEQRPQPPGELGRPSKFASGSSTANASLPTRAKTSVSRSMRSTARGDATRTPSPA